MGEAACESVAESVGVAVPDRVDACVPVELRVLAWEGEEVGVDEDVRGRAEPLTVPVAEPDRVGGMEEETDLVTDGV